MLRLDNFGLEIYGDRKATSGTKKSGNVSRTTNGHRLSLNFTQCRTHASTHKEGLYSHFIMYIRVLYSNSNDLYSEM